VPTAYLEEAVHKETERGKAMEGEWATTRQSLDALILDGDFDIVRAVSGCIARHCCQCCLPSSYGCSWGI
jgi:hypothetical protein